MAACSDTGTEPGARSPVLEGIDPQIATVGVPLTLTATGMSFVAESQLHWNDVQLPTGYVSSTTLVAEVPDSLLRTGATVQVTVRTADTSSEARTLLLRYESPTITALSQDSVTAGEGQLTIGIQGTGFAAASTVLLNGVPRATTLAAPGQLTFVLTAADRAVGTVAPISVRNPTPGGGTSAAVELTILNPAPVVEALSSDTVQLLHGESVITVTGSGFTAQSQATWNGAPRPTQVQAPTQLRFVIDTDSLHLGQGDVRIVTPAPGGGTSEARPIQVISPQPVITELPSRGATAGGGGFLLTLHGARFVEGAEVLWNGVQRAATRTGPTRLTVAVSATDVAVPGEVELRVVNPGTPPLVSEPAVFTVRGFGTPTSSVARVPLRARHLRADPVRNVLYASVGSTSADHPNSVVLIDPREGEIVASVFVGSQPGRLAVADDGSFLYVGLDGASAVRQVVLDAMTLGVQWSLPSGEVARAMEVAPGHPATVALSRHALGISPSLRGTTIYDNGVKRAGEGPGHTGASRIAFAGSPHVLYGYNDLHTGFGFYTLPLNESGIQEVRATGGLISGFGMEIAGAAGRIYSSGGHIVDPELLTRVATLSTGGGFAVDAARGRIHFMRWGYVEVWDLNTFSKRGEIPVPDFAPGQQVNHSLVRWGSDGLAVLEEDNVILIRSSLVGEP